MVALDLIEALFQSPNSHNHYQVLKLIISIKMTSRAQKSSSGWVSSPWCIKSIYSVASHSVGKVLFFLPPVEIHDFMQQQNYLWQRQRCQRPEISGFRTPIKSAWFLKNLVFLKAHVIHRTMEWNFNSNMNYFSFTCSFSQQHRGIACS